MSPLIVPWATTSAMCGRGLDTAHMSVRVVLILLSCDYAPGWGIRAGYGAVLRQVTDWLRRRAARPPWRDGPVRRDCGR